MPPPLYLPNTAPRSSYLITRFTTRNRCSASISSSSLSSGSCGWFITYALKTRTAGFFYIPLLNHSTLKSEGAILFFWIAPNAKNHLLCRLIIGKFHQIAPGFWNLDRGISVHEGVISLCGCPKTTWLSPRQHGYINLLNLHHSDGITHLAAGHRSCFWRNFQIICGILIGCPQATNGIHCDRSLAVLAE